MGKTKFKQTEIGKIPVDWDLLNAEDIKANCKKAIISGPFGSNISRKFFVKKGVPVIRGNNLKNDMTQFIDEGFVFVTKEKAKELNTYAHKEDIIFTAAGTIGQVGIINKNTKYNEYVISNKQLRLTVNKNMVNPLFVFYWFSSNWMIKYIKQRNTGSTIPLINLSILRSLPIPISHIDEQNSIVSILSSLDAKIELNQQMNKTLEELGQAIFKHWFVDFEFPNEKGKPYKSSGGEMVDSELGKIPKGWSVSTIGAELKTVLGGTPDTTNKSYWSNGTIPWINSTKVNEFRIIKSTDLITKDALRRSATELMPKRTTVLAITGATLGQISLLEIDACANQSVVGVLESNSIRSEYIYYWMNYVIKTLISWQTGGAQQHVNKTNINESYILIPNNTILNKYTTAISSVFNQITINCFEIESLAQIRDALLPKLMSGQIRVPVEVRK